jgi:hypothetical protein
MREHRCSWVVGGELGGDALGQLGGAHARVDQGAGLEAIDVVVEGEHDQGQAEEALRAHVEHAGHAVQDALERHGHLALDLLGRQARLLRDDRDLHVGDVGVGLDGRVAEGEEAVDRDAGREHERGQAPVD